MVGRSFGEAPEFTSQTTVPEVSLTSVPTVHPETALQKVAGRWMAATPDDRLHTFEGAEGVSDVGERIIELIDGVKTVEQIIESLVEEFDVSRASAEQDTREFIGLLVSKHVLRAQ
jgi:hypothetical protein